MINSICNGISVWFILRLFIPNDIEIKIYITKYNIILPISLYYIYRWYNNRIE